MKNAELCLPPGYKIRPANNDGFQPPDAAMEPVYRWIVRRFAGDASIRSVLDWGCGSGAMLVKHFGDRRTVGVDVDWRLPSLRKRWPGREWQGLGVKADADLVMCVDVIEHVDDPVAMLQTFAVGRC